MAVADSPIAPVPEAATPAVGPTAPPTRDVAPRASTTAVGIGDAATVVAADTKPLELTIEVVWGDVREQDVPVLVIGEYFDVPSHGATLAIDQALGGGLKRVLEMGLTNCRLGKVFLYPLNTPDATKAKPDEGPPAGAAAPGVPLEKPDKVKLKARAILLGGMGDPDRFGRDDFSMLMANITVAVRSFGYDRFAMVMFGTSRGGLSMDRGLRALMEGVADGVEHLPRDLRPAAMTITLIETEQTRYEEIISILDKIYKDQEDQKGQKDPKETGEGVDKIVLRPVRRPTPQWDPLQPVVAGKTDDDLPPQSETNRITVTTVTDASGVAPAPMPVTSGVAAPAEVVYEFSALSSTAAIPVRHQVVQACFVNELTPRLMTSATRRRQESYGRLLAAYVLPSDFERFLDTELPVTLVVDAKTAEVPWEMAALKGRRGPNFLGAHQLARQFRTLASAAPSIAPARNNRLDVLVIADPSAKHPLPGARAEGVEVVKALAEAEGVWNGKLKLSVTLRIGPPDASNTGDEPDARTALQAVDNVTRDALLAITNFDRIFGPGDRAELNPGRRVPPIAACDPMEILTLLLTERYDVVHYAGHGVYDPNGAKGWFFEDGWVMSASEIFKVRQVPRLVFANACHSAQTDAAPAHALASASQAKLAEWQVSIAEAFFERGISNYIGAGWPVDDGDATTFARRFYLQALGVKVKSSGEIEPCNAAPPDTLGAALATARNILIDRVGQPGKTWGAYQHYGDVNDKLLAFRNADVGAANRDRGKTPTQTSADDSDESTGDA